MCPADSLSDNIRAQIFNLKALSEIITLMSDESEDLRKVAIEAVSTLSGYRMNFPQTIVTS
jgi:hypothetical protein